VFKQNDYVSLLKEPSKSKFDEQYIGSYKILETLDNNNVRLEISDKRTKVVHSDKIRICKARPTVRPYSSAAISEDAIYTHSIRYLLPLLPRRPGRYGRTLESQSHSGSTLNIMVPLHYACILLFLFASAVIGYDCGGHGLNITNLSLLDIGDCELA